MTDSIRLTEEQVQGLVWEQVELTPDYRVSRAVYGQGPNGPVYAYRREIFAADNFLDDLVKERNANEGQKWSQGSGSEKNGNLPLMKVGSIPLNVFFRDFSKGRNADKDYKKWWWSQDRNQVFKTRKGW